jgi:hypothetical protein
MDVWILPKVDVREERSWEVVLVFEEMLSMKIPWGMKFVV